MWAAALARLRVSVCRPPAKAGLRRADTPHDHDADAHRPAAHLPTVRRELRVYGWRAGTAARAGRGSRSNPLPGVPPRAADATVHSKREAAGLISRPCEARRWADALCDVALLP